MSFFKKSNADKKLDNNKSDAQQEKILLNITGMT
jgi:hypothetical protein